MNAFVLASFPSRAYGSYRHSPISSPVASSISASVRTSSCHPSASGRSSTRTPNTSRARRNRPSSTPCSGRNRRRLSRSTPRPRPSSATATYWSQGWNPSSPRCSPNAAEQAAMKASAAGRRGPVQGLERCLRGLDRPHRRRRGPELGPGREAGEVRDPPAYLEQLAHRLAVGRHGPLAEQPPEALADVPSPDSGEHLVARRELDAEAPRPGCGAGFEGVEQLGRQPVELLERELHDRHLGHEAFRDLDRQLRRPFLGRPAARRGPPRRGARR